MYRIDLIIPGEQHFYLRTSTQQERQQWLNALGSCKASCGVVDADNFHVLVRACAVHADACMHVSAVDEGLHVLLWPKNEIHH